MNQKDKPKDIMISFRKRKGLTIDDVAIRIGCSYATMQKYESKPNTMTMDTFNKLTDIYGDDFATIFFKEKLYKMYNE